MAFNLNKPADNQTIAEGPADIRENFRALQADKIVNAQKVMDLSPGNVSGNIPVANGNLCVNLNAEKLGGNLASAFATVGHTHAAATSSSNGLMSNTDKAKLDGIAAGAEVNQNAFANVLVGATTIAADGKSDTLELAAGTNISLTPDSTNDKVIIAVTGSVENANALGNLDVGQFVRASGQAVSGDLNNYRRPGMYKVNEWTNTSNYPEGAYTWGILVVFRGDYGDSCAVGQLYLSHCGSQMFYRGGYDTGRWETWKQLATVDGNVATATRILDGGCVTAHDGAATTFLPDGITVIKAYSNGYPGTYGNVIRVGGSGDGELFLGWNGNTTVGDIFYRSKRDTADTAWSDWTRIWHAGNFTPGNYLPLSGGTVSDKLVVAKAIGTTGSYTNSQLELRAGDATGQAALGFTRPGYTAACLRHQGTGLELVDASGSVTQFKAGAIYSHGNRVPVMQYATAGDTAICMALAERSTKGTVYKKFRVQWPGFYRVKFQFAGYISVYVTCSGYTSETVSSSSSSYSAYTADIFVTAPNDQIIIVGRVNQDTYSTRTAYLKGAQVCFGGYVDELALTYGTLVD